MPASSGKFRHANVVFPAPFGPAMTIQRGFRLRFRMSDRALRLHPNYRAVGGAPSLMSNPVHGTPGRVADIRADVLVRRYTHLAAEHLTVYAGNTESHLERAITRAITHSSY